MGHPPFQTIENDKSIIIKFPIIDTVPLGEDIAFHFHLFNSTNGKAFTSGINCTFHLYNDNGNHIWLHNYSTFYEIYDIQVEIAAQNFTEIGLYSYIFQCTNQGEQGGEGGVGGFISTDFFIGVKDNTAFDDLRNIYVPIIVFAIWFLLLGIVGMVLSKTNIQEKSFWLGAISLFLSFLQVFLLVGMSYVNLNGVSILSLLKINFWLNGMVGLTILFLFLFMIYADMLQPGKEGDENRFVETKW